MVTLMESGKVKGSGFAHIRGPWSSSSASLGRRRRRELARRAAVLASKGRACGSNAEKTVRVCAVAHASCPHSSSASSSSSSGRDIVCGSTTVGHHHSSYGHAHQHAHVFHNYTDSYKHAHILYRYMQMCAWVYAFMHGFFSRRVVLPHSNHTTHTPFHTKHNLYIYI